MQKNTEKHPATCYVNGTSGEELAEQLQTVLTYCREHLGMVWITEDAIDRAQDELVTQLHDPPVTVASPAGPHLTIPLWADAATDSDDGLRELMSAAAGAGLTIEDTSDGNGLAEVEINVDNGIEHVVIPAGKHVVGTDATIDLLRTLVEEYGSTVHLVKDGVSVHGDTDLSATLLRVLTAFTTPQSDSKNQREVWSGGRPPLGFEVRHGRLAPSDEFNQVAETLQSVVDGSLTKTAAAEILGKTWPTIHNAIQEHPDRYGLRVE